MGASSGSAFGFTCQLLEPSSCNIARPAGDVQLVSDEPRPVSVVKEGDDDADDGAKDNRRTSEI